MIYPMRCQVMGIVNVTEDSFSDGGQYLATDAAVKHALQLIADGADIVDVGGESTRPGAVRVPAAVEKSRVVPVVEQLAGQHGATVSVDTMRAEVARAALDAGAQLINDVSAGLADPAMLQVCAESDAQVVLMHWKTERFGSASGTGNPNSVAPEQIVGEVREYLLQRVDAAVAAGIAPERIILDPGLGFAKNANENWALLHGLDQLVKLGFPVLVGASRKRFVASLHGDTRPPTAADPATAAISALSAAAGAWAVRVHDVAATREAVAVAHAWQAGRALTDHQATQDYPLN